MSEYKAHEESVSQAAGSFGMTWDTRADLVTLLRAGWRIEPPAPTETAEQRAEREAQEADESRFFCPHCHTYKPDHMFNMQVANLPGIGTVHWMIAVCGICRNIVSEMLIGYQMDSELMQAVKAGGGRRGGIIS